MSATDDRPAPQQYVKVNGHIVKQFDIDREHDVAPAPIETRHGRGKRIRFWGTAALPGGGRLKKTVSVELYERHPNADHKEWEAKIRAMQRWNTETNVYRRP